MSRKFPVANAPPLTDNGSEDLINGTFDWAYEEEFFCRDGFRWSPDGSMIAYWQIDASEIRDFMMINNTDSTYSFLIPVEYPKVGRNALLLPHRHRGCQRR
jgi:dipeptidyl-peptidase-4